MVKQYIGARYVPVFFENSGTGDNTWAENTAYEPLTIVTWNSNSYTSKKAVPPSVGAPNLNGDYWAMTGNYSGAIAGLSERVEGLEGDVASIENTLDNLVTHEEYYLNPTGDTTDRSADVLQKLNTYGVCIFASGDFYFSNAINMPDNTTIMGMGEKTRLILQYDGVLVNPGSYCSISNLVLVGQLSNIPYPFEGNKGSRIGIYFDGDAESFESQSYGSFFNLVSNVMIRNFNGSGIKCHRTGGTNPAVTANNVIIARCYSGIDIDVFSEFNKFTNVTVRNCHDGCVMQGGNNIFNCCEFAFNTINVLIDNTLETLINDGHSSFTGCSFVHPGVNNNGYNFQIVNLKNGIIITGCTIFHGRIDIRTSHGITICNCIIGMPSQQFMILSCDAVIINENSFLRTLPTFSFGGTQYTFDNNYSEDGLIERVLLGAGSSINSAGSLFLKDVALTNLDSRVAGVVTANGLISLAVAFPKIMPDTDYTFEVKSCTIMGVGSVTLSDITIAAKGKQFAYLQIAYADATTVNEAFLVDVVYDLTSAE